MKIFKLLKKFWWIVILALFVGGYFMISANAGKAKAAKIKTVVVQKQDLVDSLSLSGEIDAEEKASLRFQTSGLLAWVGVKEGDYVKKYQVLASLDKKELQNQMSQLMNSYMTNRWSFEQTQADNVNWQTNGMTDAARETIKRTLDKSQFSLNNSVLGVEAQALTLKFANLWTPIEGLVTSVDAPTAGQNITPATATFVVINPKTIYFSALADQTEVTKFTVGLKGTLILDSFGEKEVEGTVTSIAFTPKAGETGTVYELKMSINIDNTDQTIRMGMTGDVNFVFKEIKGVLAVPASYIKTENGKNYVWMMAGKTKQKVSVVIGETIDGNTEIVSGVNEKDVLYSN
jgi:RND family efflux transporter MFP subunit